MSLNNYSISKITISCLFILIFLSTKQSLSQTTLNSETILISDSVFEKTLIDLNIDTNGLNGNILKSDASIVEFLDVSNSSIRDLSGIEAFLNLKMLDCSTNLLKSLNLSENKKLVELNADDNYISDINLTLNTKLKIALLNDNFLSTIDISNNLELEKLGVNLNYLSELNLATNSNLKHLGCYSNVLTTIDLVTNHKLTEIHIGDNGLNTLDVSGLLDLHTLTCHDNNLSELFLTTNLELKYLDCGKNLINNLDISENSKIERLFISNNFLNEIDLSTAPNLSIFYASNNNLTALDISNNTNIRRVNCEGNNLSLVDLRNGNNSSIIEFKMTQNTSLNCVYVDNSDASFLDNWLIDESCGFAKDENECATLSTIDYEVSKISMYPNPAIDTVIFTVNTTNAKLDLYTINGKLVHSQVLNYGVNKIALTNFRSGLYLARVSSELDLDTKKLLIE